MSDILDDDMDHYEDFDDGFEEFLEDDEEPCPVCFGDGCDTTNRHVPCSFCGGTGVRQEE